MPSLTTEDIEILLKRPSRVPCPTCTASRFKNYCRQCDEFFWECPNPTCTHEHVGHRTYRDEVLATEADT